MTCVQVGWDMFNNNIMLFYEKYIYYKIKYIINIFKIYF